MNDLETYKLLRPEIKTGDMLETACNTFVGKNIRRFTGKDVNHTAFIWRTVGYQSLKDVVFIIEAINGGLDVSLLSDVVKYTNGNVYWYPLKPKYDHLRDEMGGFALRECSRKIELKKSGYDFTGLFLNAIRRVNMDAAKYYCTEFYQRILCEFEILVPAQ